MSAAAKLEAQRQITEQLRIEVAVERKKSAKV